MLTRRDFLELSLAAGAASWVSGAAAERSRTVLHIERRSIEVNGRIASRIAITQPNGFAGLVTDVDRPFCVRLENRLDVPSLIHWHGLTPPWQQDGVSGISGPPIAPGGSAHYDFPLSFAGTFYMHSHQGLQEQLLASAPLIILPPNREDEQDVVLFLNDFSFTPPEEIYAQLRKSGKEAAAASDAMAEMPGMSAMPGMAAMAMHDHAAPDLNDVTYDAFLTNDRTLADPEVIKVETGGRVRLRVINASSMTNFHLDLGELEGTLIAVDGHEIIPVKGRSFPLCVAQRLDIRLAIPNHAAAFPVLALVEGERKRTGVILSAGRAEIKKLDEMVEEVSPALTLSLESALRAKTPLSERQVDRTHRIALTGNMAGYQWSINNVVWTKDTPPFPVAEGERVELTFVNETMMAHPMHLHGHVYQVVAINGQRFAGAKRDTVLVPPKTSVTVAFDANNPGWWALHCHLLYHLEAGMFATIRYV
jgi:FtsP/CotA-like multicopper oxidase with cupredoxin domain